MEVRFTTRISGFGMRGTGIVPVLIVAGIILIGSNVNAIAGQLAIWGGVGIGLALGVLGVIGVLSRYI
ncbi:MAG TPA: hypothetical protein DCE78_02415 [Bacteroidetes bacterium]|nr:hypothetical protein [Bacteroidota bacterium]